MANVVSQLIIKLVEQVSGPAKAAEKSLKGVETAASNLGKSAGGTDKVAKSIKELSTAAKGLNVAWSEKFNAEISKLALSGDKLAKVKQEWKDLVSTIGRKDLVASMPKLDAWEASTIASLRKVEREADKAKKKGAAAGVAGEGGIGTAGLLALGRRALGPLALGYSGYALGKHAIEANAEYQREKVRGSLAGMSDAEIAASTSQAGDLSSKYRSVGQQEIMEHIRKLRGTLGDLHHAQEMVESVVQAQAVLSSGPGGKAGAIRDLDQITKGLEGAGFASDPQKFGRMLDAFVKGKNLFGETLTGEDFRTYIQRSKSSKFGLSEEYLSAIVPTMLQHEGANQFGTAQATAFNALVGGRQTKASKAKLREFGLLDKKGDVVDKDLLISNPYDWAVKNLKSRMEAAGMKLDTAAGSEERTKAVDFLMKAFSARNTGEFFAALLANLKVIEKDRANLQNAKGRDAAGDVMSKDPFQAWEAVKAQSENLAQNMMQSGGILAKALNAVAAGIGGLAWQASPEGQKVSNPTGSAHFDGMTINPIEDQEAIRKAEERARAKLDGTPNSFNFSDMAKPAEAGAAGAESGSGFRQGLRNELKGAEEDVAASVGRMLNMLNFNASPSISPKVNAPGGTPGKQSSVSQTSRQLARRIEDRSIGNFADTEYG